MSLEAGLGFAVASSDFAWLDARAGALPSGYKSKPKRHIPQGDVRLAFPSFGLRWEQGGLRWRGALDRS